MTFKLPFSLSDIGAIAGFAVAVVAVIILVRHIPMLPNSLKP